MAGSLSRSVWNVSQLTVCISTTYIIIVFQIHISRPKWNKRDQDAYAANSQRVVNTRTIVCEHTYFVLLQQFHNYSSKNGRKASNWTIHSTSGTYKWRLSGLRIGACEFVVEFSILQLYHRIVLTVQMESILCCSTFTSSGNSWSPKFVSIFRFYFCADINVHPYS